MLARWDVLRIVSLVAAGVASGYLWRAALENPTLDAVLPLNASAEPLPDWLESRVQPPTAQRVTVARRPPLRHTRHPRAQTVAVRTTLASVPASAPAAAPPQTKTQNPTPEKPRHRAKPPKAQPSSPSPPPPSPPAPPPSPPPAPPPQPPPAAAPKPPPPPPPAESPTGGGSDRPGWGRGDKNHNHTGPPGKKR